MSKLRALLLTIRNETTPIAGHTDPMALNDVWSEVFDEIDAIEHTLAGGQASESDQDRCVHGFLFCDDPSCWHVSPAAKA